MYVAFANWKQTESFLVNFMCVWWHFLGKHLWCSFMLYYKILLDLSKEKFHFTVVSMYKHSRLMKYFLWWVFDESVTDWSKKIYTDCLYIHVTGISIPFPRGMFMCGIDCTTNWRLESIKYSSTTIQSVAIKNIV